MEALAKSVKDSGDVFIQDFVATYKFSQQFMLDGGMLQPSQPSTVVDCTGRAPQPTIGPMIFAGSS